MDAPNSYNCTALHVACNNGQDVVVDTLLHYKVDYNALNNKGQTPLHYASFSPHGALCMELLVKAGADPNIQDCDGHTPLHMTAIHGFYLRTETLINHGKGYGTSMTSCYIIHGISGHVLALIGFRPFFC